MFSGMPRIAAGSKRCQRLRSAPIAVIHTAQELSNCVSPAKARPPRSPSGDAVNCERLDLFSLPRRFGQLQSESGSSDLSPTIVVFFTDWNVRARAAFRRAFGHRLLRTLRGGFRARLKPPFALAHQAAQTGIVQRRYTPPRGYTPPRWYTPPRRYTPPRYTPPR
jgi:hypothetical protein